MKKFVSLLLAVLMTAALFTGCAKQPPTSPGRKPSPFGWAD